LAEPEIDVDSLFDRPKGNGGRRSGSDDMAMAVEQEP
jgi:hypothetical protein